MNFETPFVEYLIVGAHTSIWVLLLVLAIFGVPLQSLSNWNSTLFIALIPIVYLLGAIISPLTTLLLSKSRDSIKKSVCLEKDSKNIKNYSDEKIAYLSTSLYSAYTDRVHRVRLLGPTIFNWMFLGCAVLLHVEHKLSIFILIIITTVFLSYATFLAWRQQVKRLYEFRKTAIQVISENIEKTYRKDKRKNVKGS